MFISGTYFFVWIRYLTFWNPAPEQSKNKNIYKEPVDEARAKNVPCSMKIYKKIQETHYVIKSLRIKFGVIVRTTETAVKKISKLFVYLSIFMWYACNIIQLRCTVCLSVANPSSPSVNSDLTPSSHTLSPKYSRKSFLIIPVHLSMFHVYYLSLICVVIYWFLFCCLYVRTFTHRL